MKTRYHRVTTDNKWLLVYLLAAFMTGLLVAGVFIKSYSYFKSINRPQALLNPLDGVESPEEVSTTIPKQETRWWRLYQLVRFQESNYGTKGLAATCREQGKWNEIGWLPVKGFCFQTEGDQEMTFANWITKNITFGGLTESAALCRYNTGFAYKTCAYSRGELAKAK